MKGLVLLACLLNTAGAVYYCDDADPCGLANSTEFFESYARFENCQHDAANRFCDRYIIPQWYRVNDAMLTQCPQLLSCGTIYPVWLNGTLPGSSDGIVDRKACKVGFESCCVRSYDVKIKHCGSFYAYCLAALDSCPERYCFGKNGACDVPTSAAPVTTTTKQTTPPLSTSCSEDPCIESNLHTLSDPGTRSMHCEYKQGDGHCDSSLTPGWYKADSPMLTQCPGLLSCGAIYPVWMNGTNPGQGDGVVTRQVCQRGFTGCCTTSYDIKVKNCGSYTAYCLRQLSTCPARYCFGNGRCDNNDKGKDSDKEDNKAHSHSTLEIILGVILAVLILILITLVYSCLKRFKKGHGKTGSVVNIQKSEADRETTMANPMYRSEFDNPPPYSE